MMKWNSAKTYTEEDMLRMQQEAVERVRVFQERANAATSFYDVPPSAIEAVPEPPEPPAPLPAGEDAPEAPENQVLEAQSRVVPEPPRRADPVHGLLDRLGIDSETLLILGLIFLLYNEKADNVLLLALAYLLL